MAERRSMLIRIKLFELILETLNNVDNVLLQYEGNEVLGTQVQHVIGAMNAIEQKHHINDLLDLAYTQDDRNQIPQLYELKNEIMKEYEGLI